MGALVIPIGIFIKNQQFIVRMKNMLELEVILTGKDRSISLKTT